MGDDLEALTADLDRLLASDEALRAEQASVVRRVVELYLRREDNRGATVMWRGLPRLWQDRDLLAALEAMGCGQAEYVYLPTTQWAWHRARTKPLKNQGYAFVHLACSTSFERAVGRDPPLRRGRARDVRHGRGGPGPAHHVLSGHVHLRGKSRKNSGDVHVRVGGRWAAVSKADLFHAAKPPAGQDAVRCDSFCILYFSLY